MKKLGIFIVIIFFVAIGIFAGINAASGDKQTPPQTLGIQDTTQPTQNITQEPQIGIPQKIIIDKLDVNTPIEPVQKDSQGRMDIPKNWNNTAWYSLGPKPGENGAAVIAGHVDTPSGDPSVFYGIDTLNSGDQIIIVDENGNEIKFAVTNVATYELDDMPLDEIFEKTGPARLNLITCGGDWDKEKKDYTQRIVTYAELIQ